MNDLEKHSGCIFKGHQQMDAVFPDWKIGTHKSDYTIPQTEHYNFNINILHSPYIVPLPYLLHMK